MPAVDPERLYAYALPLVGTLAGTPAGGVAATAVTDALLVADARRDELADQSLIEVWTYALTRNECLRQLRARGVFIDVRADVSLTASPEQDGPLVAAALLGLAPGDRDMLALGWSGLTPQQAALVVGAETTTSVARRSSGAADALAAAAGAVMLVVRPGGCTPLDLLLADALESGEETVSPRLRDAVTHHARACADCGRRRREFLTQALPGFALPARRALPVDIPASTVDPDTVPRRAGRFGPEGFPVPLEHDDIAGVRWLRRAVLAGVVSSGLLLMGALLYLAVLR